MAGIKVMSCWLKERPWGIPQPMLHWLLLLMASWIIGGNALAGGFYQTGGTLPASPRSIPLATHLPANIHPDTTNPGGSSHNPSLNTPPTATFRMLVQMARQSFREGAYTEAANRFDQLQREYGTENEFQDPVFRKAMLPLWAYAHLASAPPNPHKAATLLEEHLLLLDDSRATSSRQRLFTLLLLAKAYGASDAPRAAADTCQRIIHDYPNTPEASLATLQRVEILFQLGDSQTADHLVDTMDQKILSSTLCQHARLIALNQATRRGDTRRAATLLLHTPWSFQTMPEVGILTWAGLKLGDHYLAQKQYSQAAQAYRHVLPRATLIRLQQERLSHYRRKADGERQRTAWQSITAMTLGDYYSTLATRLQTELQAIAGTEDYTAAFYLRYGQSLLLSNRIH